MFKAGFTALICREIFSTEGVNQMADIARFTATKCYFQLQIFVGFYISFVRKVPSNVQDITTKRHQRQSRVKFIIRFTISLTFCREKKRKLLVNGNKNYVFIHKNSFIVPYFFIICCIYFYFSPSLPFYKYGITFVDFIPMLQLDFCECYFHSHAFIFGSSSFSLL